MAALGLRLLPVLLQALLPPPSVVTASHRACGQLLRVLVHTTHMTTRRPSLPVLWLPHGSRLTQRSARAT